MRFSVKNSTIINNFEKNFDEAAETLDTKFQYLKDNFEKKQLVDGI